MQRMLTLFPQGAWSSFSPSLHLCGEIIKPMILIDRFLLPPNLSDAQRQAIVSKWARKRRGMNSRIVAVLPGEDGWIHQLGNKDGTVYFGVVERRLSPPSLQQSRQRKSW